MRRVSCSTLPMWYSRSPSRSQPVSPSPPACAALTKHRCSAQRALHAAFYADRRNRRSRRWKPAPDSCLTCFCLRCRARRAGLGCSSSTAFCPCQVWSFFSVISAVVQSKGCLSLHALLLQVLDLYAFTRVRQLAVSLVWRLCTWAPQHHLLKGGWAMRKGRAVAAERSRRRSEEFHMQAGEQSSRPGIPQRRVSCLQRSRLHACDCAPSVSRGLGHAIPDRLPPSGNRRFHLPGLLKSRPRRRGGRQRPPPCECRPALYVYLVSSCYTGGSLLFGRNELCTHLLVTPPRSGVWPTLCAWQAAPHLH